VSDGVYQPDRGDFVYLDFTPQAGNEQAGRRPALVLSPRDYNIATGQCLACPLTNQIKGSVWEVAVPKGARLTGVILANQVRAVDWIARNVAFHSKSDQETLEEVLGRIEAILAIDR
jgi:mRNA interferase MazF